MFQRLLKRSLQLSHGLLVFSPGLYLVKRTDHRRQLKNADAFSCCSGTIHPEMVLSNTAIIKMPHQQRVCIYIGECDHISQVTCEVKEAITVTGKTDDSK